MNSPFTYFSNRASRLYQAAFEPLGGRSYTGRGEAIDFLYFDAHGDKRPPECELVGFQLMDRRLTIPLDNKARMAKTLMAAGLRKPTVFFEVENVPEEGGRSWFVKNPLAAGG